MIEPWLRIQGHFAFRSNAVKGCLMPESWHGLNEGNAKFVVFLSRMGYALAGNDACLVRNLVIHQVTSIDGDSKPGSSGTI